MISVALVFLLVLSGSIYLIYSSQKRREVEKEEQKIDGIHVILEDYEISALIVEGNAIIAGGKDGVYRIDIESGKIIEVISTDISLVYTASMMRSHNGDLWIGHDSGLSIYNESGWIHIESPTIPKGRCNKIIETNDHIYAGFQEGLAIFLTEDSSSYEVKSILNKKNGLKENNVNAIYEDSSKQLWFGAYLSNEFGGLSIQREDKWEYVSIDQGLAHKYITDIKGFDYDTQEYVIVGGGHLTSGGLSLFTVREDGNELIKSFQVEDGLPGEKVRSLYVSENNDIWITTESDGLLITSMEILAEGDDLAGIYLDKTHGLSDNEIKVVGENENYYILGGRFGITIIEKRIINDHQSLVIDKSYILNP